MDLEKKPVMPVTTPAWADMKSGELVEEVTEAPITEVINAVMQLPEEDKQALYDALGKDLKAKKKSAKKAEATEEEEPTYDMQEMARAFM